MTNRLADDVTEIAKHRKALQIARADPELLTKCACLKGALQSGCTVCNDPQVSCIGCIRRRTGDSSRSLSECPICWHSPSTSCPTR